MKRGEIKMSKKVLRTVSVMISQPFFITPTPKNTEWYILVCPGTSSKLCGCLKNTELNHELLRQQGQFSK
jgi:hypothetical protein